MTLRNRLAGNTSSYHSFDLPEAMEGIAAAGFKYIELSAVRGRTEHVPLEGNSEALGAIRRSLQRLNLVPVSLSGHSDLSTTEGLECGLKVIGLCERLEVGIMIAATGREGGEAAFYTNVRELADRAAARGIQVAIEVAGDMAPTGRLAAEVVDRIARDNVSINYDTANTEYYGDVKAVDDLPSVVNRLGHIHLKDKRGGRGVWDFPALGEGHVDFPAVLDILARDRYAGPISVEVEFMDDPWPALAEVDRAMKTSYEYLVALGLS